MQIDLVNLVITTLISAAVQGLVGLLIWFAVRRNIEKLDRLQDRVDDLEEQRLGKIQKELDENAEKIVWIRTHFVHKEECEKLHQQSVSQYERFATAVNDLSRVQEATEHNTKNLDILSQRLIAVVQDVARVEARQEIPR